MECLKNFSLSISQTRTFSTPGTNVKTWGATNQYWEVYLNTVNTTKQIAGFKNINVYKIAMVGDVGATLGTNAGLVDDFGFAVACNGQNSIIGGTINPNGYAADENNTAFFLSKFNSIVEFPDGIQSCQSVAITDFFAKGTGAENAGILTLSLRVDFLFYYKFEGE